MFCWHLLIFVLIFIVFCSDFYISFLGLALSSHCYSFSSFLMEFKLLIWDFSSFLMYPFNATYKFPLQHSFSWSLEKFQLCIIMYTQFNVFLTVSLETSFSIHGLFTSLFLVSKCLEIFLLSFWYWYLVGFHCCERTHCVWFQLKKLLRVVGFFVCVCGSG